MATSVGNGVVVRRVAMAVATVDLLGVVCLILFFVVGGPFGLINDVANAAVGVLSAVLAWLSPAIRPPAWHRLALAAAVTGAIVMAIGSVLVIFGATGYYLAGLVSAVGAAFIGCWLLIANRFPPYAGELPRAVRTTGLAAGGVMLAGLLAVPGVLARADDQDASPWYVSVAQLSWLGTYLLYPIWCLRLARTQRPGDYIHLSTEEVEPNCQLGNELARRSRRWPCSGRVCPGQRRCPLGTGSSHAYGHATGTQGPRNSTQDPRNRRVRQTASPASIHAAR
jgi:hypothetical protein